MARLAALDRMQPRRACRSRCWLGGFAVLALTILAGTARAESPDAAVLSAQPQRADTAKASSARHAEDDLPAVLLAADLAVGLGVRATAEGGATIPGAPLGVFLRGSRITTGSLFGDRAVASVGDLAVGLVGRARPVLVLARVGAGYASVQHESCSLFEDCRSTGRSDEASLMLDLRLLVQPFGNAFVLGAMGDGHFMGQEAALTLGAALGVVI